MSAVRSAPPPTAPASSGVVSKNKRKKNKKGKKLSEAPEGLHDDDDDEDEPPLLEDLDSAQRSNFVNPPATNGNANLSLSTPSDLLSTASDLYRQIEAAAASALSTHPSFAASFPPPPAGTGAATDEAYWTSLPQHLRQFIRSALPLAAGLTSPVGQNGSLGIGVGVTGVNGQSLPPLTHEQLSSAAAQLAQVVQSNWGQLGLGPIPPGAQAQLGNVTAAANGTSRGATISLGSFPVTMPTREQMEAAIGSIGGMELGGGLRLEEENVFDLTEDEDSKEGEETGTKKKNKKKKKKNAAVVPEAPPIVPTPPTPLLSPDAARLRQTARRPPFTTTPTAAPRQPPPKSAPAPPTTNINGKNRAADPPALSPPPQSIAAGKQPQYAADAADPPASRLAAPSISQPTPQSQQRIVQTPSIAPKAGPSSERERIRDFWLGLKEGERRALVKVEKEAVLRKMKEQQRSGCSCAVCGRKRTAIEEELEVLYDAYYDELESYANHQVRYASSGGTIAPPPGPGPFPGSVDAAAIAPPVPVAKKTGAIVKTTRDHKNVRPAAKKKLNNTVAKPPPSHTHAHQEGPAHGEPGHTHSPSCPHHPHNHSHSTPATTAAKAKGAAVEQETYDDEEEDEEEEEDDGEYDEDEYDEEDEEEEQYDEDAVDSQANDEAKKGTGKRGDSGADFFGFGKSLTVKGGILTVADDLLKNDGQKFLEMMEQLADKRIQRDQETFESIVEIESDEGSDEGEYDEDDEEDDDENDEEDDEDEEVMTEAERMEEGRRMFQIFAARMFEQRVLAAYRHKVATERQEQLLRELEEEERLAEEKELKKAKENQKKKDKKKDQKQKKEEDRLRKEAEKDALEEAQRTAEAARQEEERRRNEEQRAKREVEKKLKEEERQRVSEEKKKRAEEESKRRKEREEKLRVEKEARLAKEKEEREKKAKDDAERKSRELAERLEREEKQEKDRIEKEKAEAEAKAQAEKDRLARTAQAAATAAARIKAQSAKSTPAPRQQPVKAIPGLPKPSPKPTPIPSANARPPHLSLPPGVIPRQPSGMQQVPPPQLQQIPPSAARNHQVPYGQSRAPAMPLVQQIPSGGVPSASSRSFGPAGGFGAPHQQQTSSFVAHPQTQHSIGQVSPVLARAPIGPPPPLPSTSIPLTTSNGGPSPRQNGFAPIGPPPTLAQPPLGLSSPTPRPTGIISPIGRPSSSVSTANNSFSGPASLRSISPPPRVFGSSALFEDDEVVQSSSRGAGAGAGAGAGGPASWSSPFGSIWSQAQAPPPPPPPDRLSVIRDRARVTHLRLDASGGPVPINDLHRTLVSLWPDSSSVDLRELVEAMLIAGTGGNGGGTFVFSQRGEGLVVVFAT